MSATHGSPPEGLECMVLLDDITEENYCEYQCMPSGLWHPAKACSEVVKELIDTQFNKYLDDVEKATKDCAAAVRRLVDKGPPVYLSDPHALPMPEGETHIEKVWYMAENEEVSSRLKGALEGEEREKLWTSQKEVLASMEAVEASSKESE
mmetsp:Transcript_6743/g.10652  ORF Transcript_6743/g.10652 Transcript_6743/m.10652 type:complete len:151 (+) Transcript_6743:85-537(+)|eukprot:CAMPEP_0184291178 /NCGR_PEP_ID=MMETSP1049-20130417/3251_1 /TAXON_ID=77928 /ORGANISM="Proteomonas sulcata, Strain CCMP704" /LENGTH=150 /DNA_ID=CAMNT_0026598531 /DNA_START=129 /DNA_END=581 /DNA_ORIENTATION=-